MTLESKSTLKQKLETTGRKCINCGHLFEIKTRKNGKKDYARQCIACRDFKRNHGFTLTHEDRAMLNAEPWCFICHAEDDLVIDHDHNTNKVRHYLCRTCNTGIGNFHDNIGKLQQAIIYLQQHALQQKEKD